MATNLLWFVLAGFLLGFATSTLWEWFYFRKERLKLTDRRIRELEAKLREPETISDSITPINSTLASAATTDSPSANVSSQKASVTSAWSDPAYRSPGVFLETEEYERDEGERSAAGQDKARTMPTASAGSAPITPPTPKPSPAPPSEPTIQPRNEPSPNEPSPADALRARRGDSPRSRQEVLAALRRNSDPGRRGQAPRTEDESQQAGASPEESPQFFQSRTLQSHPLQPRESTLVSPVPPAPEPPAIIPPAPKAPAIEPSAQTTAAEHSTVSTPPSDMTPARQRWANNPTLTRRSEEYPDDLSKIRGIGDVYKQRLYRAGIYTWKQIAEGDVATLRQATSAYPSSNVDEWLVQAQKLMEKHGRTSAAYSGPPPDDMTNILGIGPVSASVLYRAGICTYEQLASTPIADLEALFPIAVAGDQPDFEQWVKRAANLADEKHRDA